MIKSFALVFALQVVAITSAFAQLRPDASSSPEQVITMFCKADLMGKQLTGSGRTEIAHFFDSYAWKPNRISVVMDCIHGKAKIQDENAKIRVEQLTFGQIDKDLHFIPMHTDNPKNPSLVILPYALIRSKAANDSILSWKIASQYPPSISVDAAIRYVDMVKKEAKDDIVRANADKTLDMLKKLKGAKDPYK